MLQQFDYIFNNLYNVAKHNKSNLTLLYNDFVFDNIIITDDKWNKYKFLFKHSPLHMIINTKEKFNIFDISYIFETSPNLISLVFNQDFNLDLNDIIFPKSFNVIRFVIIIFCAIGANFIILFFRFCFNSFVFARLFLSYIIFIYPIEKSLFISRSF